MALKPLTTRAAAALTPTQILEAHARHESAQQLSTPGQLYKNLLAVVHKRLAEEWGVEVGWEESVANGLSGRDWPVFDDSVEALRYLNQH